MRWAGFVFSLAILGCGPADAQDFLLIETPNQTITVEAAQIVDVVEFDFQENDIDRDFWVYFDPATSSAVKSARRGEPYLAVTVGLCGAVVRGGFYLREQRLHVLFSDSEGMEQRADAFAQTIQKRSCP